MGKLQSVYRIRLAYPAMLRLDPGAPPAVAHFPKTGNTVRIEPSRYGPAADQPTLEGFEQMTLCVEDECTDEQGRDTSSANCEHLLVDQDPDNALWQLLEAQRAEAADLGDPVEYRAANGSWVLRETRQERLKQHGFQPIIGKIAHKARIQVIDFPRRVVLSGRRAAYGLLGELP
jgi:hypothetical protein